MEARKFLTMGEIQPFFKTYATYETEIHDIHFNLKSGSHLPKQFLFICFNESPLKIMKNASYFILKTLFVLKIFEFLS